MNRQKNIITTKVFNARFNSIVSISLVLLLTGIMLLLGFVAHRLSKHVKENITLSVVLDDSMLSSERTQLQQKLESMPWAKSVTYIDKEKALKDLTENLGENPEEFLGNNPLLASYEIFLNAEYASSDSIAKIEASLKEYQTVEDVVYRKDLIHLVNDNIQRIGAFLLILAILLTIISFSLIRNTVRLKIYAKRFQIRTMQLVGASNGFILKPFLKENLWSGIISSVVSSVGIWIVSAYVEKRFAGLQLIDTTGLVLIFGCLLVFGMLIILSATWLAVYKYLKMSINELYYA